MDGFNNTDAFGNPTTPIVNELTNFGWEYVWHCHILSHEEMDMMRPIAVDVNTTLPDAPVASAVRNGGDVVVSWTDATPPAYLSLATWGDPKSEIGFRIERATGTSGGTFTQIGTALANTSTFTDPGAATGTYRYRVVAYNASPGVATSNEAVPAAPAGPATGVTLTPNLSSPRPVGTAVTFTAEGQGTTLPYEYRFWLYDGVTWTIAQDFSALNTWTLPASTPPGNYTVGVWVRTNTASTAFDAQAFQEFQIGAAVSPATGVRLSASLGSPQTTGTAVEFTAEGEGSTGYEYRFWLYDGTTWTIAQDFSALNTWTLPTSTPSGNYTVGVWVRTDTASNAMEAQSFIPYVLQ
jgi:hypothetical protein